jgi:hypothetical protein
MFFFSRIRGLSRGEVGGYRYGWWSRLPPAPT